MTAAHHARNFMRYPPVSASTGADLALPRGGADMSTQTALNTPSIPWWISAVVLLGSLLTATGAVLALVHPAMLVSPHDEINAAVHVYAGYLAARNGALTIMLLVLL